MFKTTGGLLTELLNMLVLVESKTIDGVLKDFIAFGFISEIDNYMLYTVKRVNGEEEVDSAEMYYDKS